MRIEMTDAVTADDLMVSIGRTARGCVVMMFPEGGEPSVHWSDSEDAAELAAMLDGESLAIPRDALTIGFRCALAELAPSESEDEGWEPKFTTFPVCNGIGWDVDYAFCTINTASAPSSLLLANRRTCEVKHLDLLRADAAEELLKVMPAMSPQRADACIEAFRLSHIHSGCADESRSGGSRS